MTDSRSLALPRTCLVSPIWATDLWPSGRWSPKQMVAARPQWPQRPAGPRRLPDDVTHLSGQPQRPDGKLLGMDTALPWEVGSDGEGSQTWTFLAPRDGEKKI